MTERPMTGEVLWTLAEAQALVLDLEQSLKKLGYHVGLIGSVLTTGVSGKDVDLVIFPHCADQRKTNSTSFLGIKEAIEKVGLRRVFDHEQIRKFWRDKGSTDNKTVEVWTYNGRRVDIFFMR